MKLHSTHFSLCERCGRPAVHAVCCPICGRSCCRWKCYARHLNHHQSARARAGVSMPDDSREGETGQLDADLEAADFPFSANEDGAVNVSPFPHASPPGKRGCLIRRLECG
jgi:hypothetical protein